jgi:hypothetical protein
VNTPSHYILNLALLSKTSASKSNVTITIGAIVPDVPIFIFYSIAKFVYKLPEKQIWTQTYYEPFWQNFVAIFHSIPLAAIGMLSCLAIGSKPGAIFFASTILHSLCDLPVHHDDAHRHFFPFSDYRFISPLSYWDVNHHAKIVAFVELLMVLVVTPSVINLLSSFAAKGLLIAIGLFYTIGYFRLYIFK